MTPKATTPLVTPFSHSRAPPSQLDPNPPDRPRTTGPAEELSTSIVLSLRNAIGNLRTQMEVIQADLHTISQNVDTLKQKPPNATLAEVEDALRNQMPSAVQEISENLASQLGKTIASLPSAVAATILPLLPKIDENISLIRQRLDAQSRTVDATQTLQPLINHLISLLAPISTLAIALPTLVPRLTEHAKLSTDLLSSLAEFIATLTGFEARMDDKLTLLGREVEILMVANAKKEDHQWESTMALDRGIREGQEAEGVARKEPDRRMVSEAEQNERSCYDVADFMASRKCQENGNLAMKKDEGVSIEKGGESVEKWDHDVGPAATTAVAANAVIAQSTIRVDPATNQYPPESSRCQQLEHDSARSKKPNSFAALPFELETDVLASSQGSSVNVLHVFQQAVSKQDEENQQGGTATIDLPFAIASRIESIEDDSRDDTTASSKVDLSSTRSLKRKYTSTNSEQTEPATKRRILLDPDEEDDGEVDFAS